MSSSLRAGWQFWIDRGGTFTDVVALDPSGRLETRKLLSENPLHYADAAVAALADILAGAPPSERRVEAVKMGTTVATNALLERRGAKTALVITAGLADALRIGAQSRPDIFALDIELPEMLYGTVIEAEERVTATGEVLIRLDEARLARDLDDARTRGYASVAIVLLHGYRHPEHERRAAALARGLGFAQVSVSHEVSPLMKLVPRGDITLVDAYLSPVLGRYVEQLRRGLSAHAPDAPLMFMQSHGGLASARRFRGRDSILSGPAAGVVGMARSAAHAGYGKLIGFDMGGTSTDVSLYAGEFERRSDTVIGGVRIAVPMMSIDTVAAGGGSVLEFAAGRLQVGPESAGAAPGPACYRGGGPLTITDANVLLGRIQPDFFPSVFGAGADQALDATVVHTGFAALAERVAAETGRHLEPEALALGFLRIAVERMAGAIKRISVERGHDSTEFALASFGGAGGQHACQVADALGIETVLIHPLAGLLSAYGMGLADSTALRLAAVEAPLSEASLAELETTFAALERAAADELEAEESALLAIDSARRISLKQAGSDTTLKLSCPAGTVLATLREAFDRAHAEHFGFAAAAVPLVIETVEVEAVGRVSKPLEPRWPEQPRAEPAALRQVWFGDGRHATPIYERARLAVGQRIAGPALVSEANATTLIDPE